MTEPVPATAFCRICGRPVKETGWRIVRKFSPRCACGSQEIEYVDTDKKPLTPDTELP